MIFMTELYKGHFFFIDKIKKLKDDVFVGECYNESVLSFNWHLLTVICYGCVMICVWHAELNCKFSSKLL